MKREIKIALIIFGSLFALVAIAIVALAVIIARYGPEIARQASDPVAMKRTAAKIATFDVPKGYRIDSATDLKFTQIVSIVSDHRGVGSFRMQLQGTMYGAGDGQLTGVRAGMSVVGRFINCHLHDAGTDDVTVRGVDVKLTIVRCWGTHGPMRIETGSFPGNAPEATITATGVGAGAFDEAALHELLRSVR